MFLLAILASSLAAANRYFVHNLASDLPGVADQEDDQLINPWDFVSFNAFMPVGFPSCTPPDVSSVPLANNGTGIVSQYTPIPKTVVPESYPYLVHGITGIMGSYGLPQQGPHALSDGLLFCTEDGTIVGLPVFPPTFLTTLVDNSKSGAVYKGCTTGCPLGANGYFRFRPIRCDRSWNRVSERRGSKAGRIRTHGENRSSNAFSSHAIA